MICQCNHAHTNVTVAQTGSAIDTFEIHVQYAFRKTPRNETSWAEQ